MKIDISYLPEEETKAGQIERILRAVLLVEKIQYSDKRPPYRNTRIIEEAPQAPAVAPLTFDDLWKLDGQPVWVERPNGVSQYYIAVSTEEGLDLYRGGCGYEGFADYGKTWLAYRRKPEGKP